MHLPSQPAQSVRCFAATREQADRMVNQLKTAGFVLDEISMEYPDRGANRPVEPKPETKPAIAIMAGAGLGGIIGMVVGWTAIAVLVGYGQVFARFCGVILGAILGAIAGWLIVRSTHRDKYWRHKAKYSEGRVEAGNIIISVKTGDAEKLRLALQILPGSAVSVMDVTIESSAPAPGKISPTSPPSANTTAGILK